MSNLNQHNIYGQNTQIQPIRCAIYTRKSHEEGLEQQFNSLDAQRLAGEHFIQSHTHEGWAALPERYDDGGYSGGTLERPGLQKLLRDIQAGLINCVVVYKIDRLSRSLLDFAKLVDVFDEHKVNFVSITQSFTTANSMGRLTLNILLSFAQYERELTGERIRDKFALSKSKGLWMGGCPPLGYDINARKLVINEKEASLVKLIFEKFLELKSITKLVAFLNDHGYRTKAWVSSTNRVYPGQAFTKRAARYILTNPMYKGCISHRGHVYEGEHEAIIEPETWDNAQAIFATNPHIRARESASKTPPVLLKGIIHCAACQSPMMATYTKKNNQRYHYYLCSAKYRGLKQDCPLRSISGPTVEKLVTLHVRRFLKSPEMIAKVCAQASAELNEAAVIQHMHNVEELWNELFPHEQQRITQLLVEGVYLKVDGVEVRMRTEGLASLMGEVEDEEYRDIDEQEGEQRELLRLKQEQVFKKMA